MSCESASALAVSAGNGVEDVIIGNDRSVGDAARDILRFLGWL